MGLEFDDMPKWAKQGRTGPGDAAPRYASRKDRRKVRKDNQGKVKISCGLFLFMVLGSAAGSILLYYCPVHLW